MSNQIKKINQHVLDFVEKENAGHRGIRVVPLGTALEVARRSLVKTEGQAFSVRRFHAMSDVSDYITLVQRNKKNFGTQPNTDLLPVAHPASTRPHLMSEFQVRHARARWYADDPRVVDDGVRSLLATAFTAPSASPEYLYATSRLLAMGATRVPVEALVAVAFGFNDGANRGFWRQQLRDRKGRFAKMGGKLKKLFRRGGQVFAQYGDVVSTNNNTFIMETPDNRLIRAEATTVETEEVKALLPSEATPDGVSATPVRFDSADPVIDEANFEYVDQPDGFVRKDVNEVNLPNGISADQVDSVWSDDLDNYQVVKYGRGAAPGGDEAQDFYVIGREEEGGVIVPFSSANRWSDIQKAIELDEPEFAKGNDAKVDLPEGLDIGPSRELDTADAPEAPTALKQSVSAEEVQNIKEQSMLDHIKEQGRYPLPRGAQGFIGETTDIAEGAKRDYKKTYDLLSEANPEIPGKGAFKDEYSDFDSFWNRVQKYGVDASTRAWDSVDDIPEEMKLFNRAYAESVLGLDPNGEVTLYRNVINRPLTTQQAGTGYWSTDRDFAKDYGATPDKTGSAVGLNGFYTGKFRPDQIGGMLGYSQTEDEFAVVIGPDAAGQEGRVTRLGDVAPSELPDFIKNIRIEPLSPGGRTTTAGAEVEASRRTGGSAFRFNALAGSMNFRKVDNNPMGDGGLQEFFDANGITKEDWAARYDELYGEGSYQESRDAGNNPSFQEIKKAFIQDEDGKWFLDVLRIDNPNNTSLSIPYYGTRDPAGWKLDEFDSKMKMLGLVQSITGEEFMSERKYEVSDAVDDIPETEAPEGRVEDGKYILDRGPYTPSGACLLPLRASASSCIDGVESEDYTDDPAELASRFSPDVLSEKLKESVDDGTGVVRLEFEAGEEDVPAEAVYNALKEQGMDADAFVDGVEADEDVRIQGPDRDAIEELDRKGGGRNQDATALRELLGDELPAVAQGLSDRELQKLIDDQFNYAGLINDIEELDVPEGFYEMFPDLIDPRDDIAGAPEGFQPFQLAIEFSPDVLETQLRNALSPDAERPGYGTFEMMDEDGEMTSFDVPAEAIFDALELNGVDANALLREIYGAEPSEEEIQDAIDGEGITDEDIVPQGDAPALTEESIEQIVEGLDEWVAFDENEVLATGDYTSPDGRLKITVELDVDGRQATVELDGQVLGTRLAEDIRGVRDVVEELLLDQATRDTADAPEAPELTEGYVDEAIDGLEDWVTFDENEVLTPGEYESPDGRLKITVEDDVDGRQATVELDGQVIGTRVAESIENLRRVVDDLLQDRIPGEPDSDIERTVDGLADWVTFDEDETLTPGEYTSPDGNLKITIEDDEDGRQAVVEVDGRVLGIRLAETLEALRNEVEELLTNNRGADADADLADWVTFDEDEVVTPGEYTSPDGRLKITIEDDVDGRQAVVQLDGRTLGIRVAETIEDLRRQVENLLDTDKDPEGTPTIDAIENAEAVFGGLTRQQKDELIESTKQGGYTVDFVSGEVPNSGYMVASEADIPAGPNGFRKREEVVSFDDFASDPDKFIDAFVGRNIDKLEQDNYYIGTWTSTDDDGNVWVYLDVSERFDNKEEALEAAKERDEIAIFGIEEFEEFFTDPEREAQKNAGTEQTQEPKEDGVGTEQLPRNDSGRTPTVDEGDVGEDSGDTEGGGEGVVPPTSTPDGEGPAGSGDEEYTPEELANGYGADPDGEDSFVLDGGNGESIIIEKLPNGRWNVRYYRWDDPAGINVVDQDIADFETATEAFDFGNGQLSSPREFDEQDAVRDRVASDDLGPDAPEDPKRPRTEEEIQAAVKQIEDNARELSPELIAEGFSFGVEGPGEWDGGESADGGRIIVQRLPNGRWNIALVVGEEPDGVEVRDVAQFDTAYEAFDEANELRDTPFDFDGGRVFDTIESAWENALTDPDNPAEEPKEAAPPPGTFSAEETAALLSQLDAELAEAGNKRFIDGDKDIRAQVEAAIQNGDRLFFWYNGKRREVKPQSIWENPKNGNVIMYAEDKLEGINKNFILSNMEELPDGEDTEPVELQMTPRVAEKINAAVSVAPEDSDGVNAQAIVDQIERIRLRNRDLLMSQGRDRKNLPPIPEKYRRQVFIRLLAGLYADENGNPLAEGDRVVHRRDSMAKKYGEGVVVGKVQGKIGGLQRKGVVYVDYVLVEYPNGDVRKYASRFQRHVDGDVARRRFDEEPRINWMNEDEMKEALAERAKKPRKKLTAAAEQDEQVANVEAEKIASKSAFQDLNPDAQPDDFNMNIGETANRTLIEQAPVGATFDVEYYDIQGGGALNKEVAFKERWQKVSAGGWLVETPDGAKFLKDDKEATLYLGMVGIDYDNNFMRKDGRGYRISQPKFGGVKTVDLQEMLRAKNVDTFTAKQANPSSRNQTGIFNEYDPERRLGEDSNAAETTPLSELGFDPDEDITIYRGVPEGVTEINPGDWVTANEQLARDYAGGGDVLSQTVKARDLKGDPSAGEGGYTEEMVYAPVRTDEEEQAPSEAPNGIIVGDKFADMENKDAVLEGLREVAEALPKWRNPRGPRRLREIRRALDDLISRLERADDPMQVFNSRLSLIEQLAIAGEQWTSANTDPDLGEKWRSAMDAANDLRLLQRVAGEQKEAIAEKQKEELRIARETEFPGEVSGTMFNNPEDVLNFLSEVKKRLTRPDLNPSYDEQMAWETTNRSVEDLADVVKNRSAYSEEEYFEKINDVSYRVVNAIHYLESAKAKNIRDDNQQSAQVMKTLLEKLREFDVARKLWVASEEQRLADLVFEEIARPLPDDIVPGADNIRSAKLRTFLYTLLNRIPEKNLSRIPAINKPGFSKARDGINAVIASVDSAVDNDRLPFFSVQGLKDAITGLETALDSRPELAAQVTEPLKTALQNIEEAQFNAPVPSIQKNGLSGEDPLEIAEDRIEARENLIQPSEKLTRLLGAEGEGYGSDADYLEAIKGNIQAFFDGEERSLAELGARERAGVERFVATLIKQKKVNDPELRDELAELLFKLDDEENAYLPDRGGLGEDAQILKDTNPDEIFALQEDDQLIVGGEVTPWVMGSSYDINGINDTVKLIHNKTGQVIWFKRERGYAGPEGALNERRAAVVLRAMGFAGAAHVEAHNTDPGVSIMTTAGENMRVSRDFDMFANVAGSGPYSRRGAAETINILDIIRMEIFDAATYNGDRHGGNFLMADKNDYGVGSNGVETHRIVPIDHGFAGGLSDDPADINLVNNMSVFDYYRSEGTRAAGGALATGLMDYIGQGMYAKITRMTVQQAVQRLRNMGASEDYVQRIIARMENIGSMTDSEWNRIFSNRI